MDELTKVALLGTSRYSGPIPTGDQPAASLVAAEPSADREESLLLACGAQAVYALAGRLPESGIEPGVPALEETKKPASRRIASLLESASAEQGNTLLLEFLKLMAGRGVVLPPDLLPRLLETKDVELRHRLTPVLGERGAWLCRQNPDWAPFVTLVADRPVASTEELKRIWDEGTIEERCQTIETLRQLDPSLAREWVEEALPKEKHGNRMKLLKSLRTGLVPGDEPFLERCLDDRSPAIGQVAAGFLCDLPDSALAQRMRNRAAGLFTMEKKSLALEGIQANLHAPVGARARLGTRRLQEESRRTRRPAPRGPSIWSPLFRLRSGRANSVSSRPSSWPRWPTIRSLRQ